MKWLFIKSNNFYINILKIILRFLLSVVIIFLLYRVGLLINPMPKQLTIIIPIKEYQKNDKDAKGFKFRVECENNDNIRILTSMGLIYYKNFDEEYESGMQINDFCNKDFYWNTANSSFNNAYGTILIDVLDNDTYENKLFEIDASGDTIKYVENKGE